MEKVRCHVLTLSNFQYQLWKITLNVGMENIKHIQKKKEDQQIRPWL